jgi:hypothetical protein
MMKMKAVALVNGRGERGAAMLAVIMTVVIVTAISVSLVGLMGTDITHASIQYAVARSFYIAQAGLEQAKVQVFTAADPVAYTTPDAGVMMPYGGGQFTYWVDAGPATRCGAGLKTLEALGQVPFLSRTLSTRVRACGVPGTPFLAALFGVSRIQFQGAASRTYLAPYLIGTPGGGGSLGSFTEINFSDNDVRVNALSEESSETVTLRDGTAFDYTLFGFSDRPNYISTPTTDPAPWILAVFGDLIKAQPASGLIPTPCGTPYACVTVGNDITDVQQVTHLREASYMRHVYVKSMRRETVPQLDLDPEIFRAQASQNTSNAALNSTVGLRDKRASIYTSREFSRITTYLAWNPSQSLKGTIYIDGTPLLFQSVNLGGTSGNVTLAVRGDLIIGGRATITNTHDLSTAAGRRIPGIVVLGSPGSNGPTRRVCGDELSGSGRVVVCTGGSLVVDGLVYTQDGMALGPTAHVDQVGAMYHNNNGTPNPSFINDNAIVVLRFDPLALSVFGQGIAILSWQQLHGPGGAAPVQPSPLAIAPSPPAPTSATPLAAPEAPPASVPTPAASESTLPPPQIR